MLYHINLLECSIPLLYSSIAKTKPNPIQSNPCFAYNASTRTFSASNYFPTIVLIVHMIIIIIYMVVLMIRMIVIMIRMIVIIFHRSWPSSTLWLLEESAQSLLSASKRRDSPLLRLVTISTIDVIGNGWFFLSNLHIFWRFTHVEVSLCCHLQASVVNFLLYIFAHFFFYMPMKHNAF